MDLYQELILDHAKVEHPLGEPFDAQVHHINPTCGDEVTLRVHVDGVGADARVADVSYQAQGCAISRAATSVMYDLTKDRPITQVSAVSQAFRALMHSQGHGEPDEDVLGDGVAFAGVAKYPSRVKCALLGWMALADALQQTTGTKEQA